MNCNRCGNKIIEGTSFCSNCGQMVTNYQNNNNQNNKKDYGLAFSIAFIISFLLVVGFLSYNGSNNKEENNNEVVPSSSNIISNTNSNSNSNPSSNSNEPMPDITSYEKIVYQGYSLQVPKEYNAYVKDEYLYVFNLKNGSYALIHIFDGSYDDLKKQKDLLQKELLEDGIEASEFQLKKTSDRELLVSELAKENTIYALSKLETRKTWQFMVFSQNGTLDYESLKLVVAIINSAKKDNGAIEM